MNDVIDIVMVTHNQRCFTEACINSLYRNTRPEIFHLIVVDGNSTDGTVDYLKNLRAREDISNLDIVFSDENLGWCRGLNAGFDYLSQGGRYVLWCNNDVLFEPQWAEKMVGCFRGNIGAVGPTSNYIMGRQKFIFNHGHKIESAPFLIGFFLMFRREVIDIVGDVDERFGLGGSDEMDYIIRMKRDLGMECVICREVYIHHFGSKTLWDIAGGTAQSYDDYVQVKDKVLREKWGDETVDQYLGYSQKQVLVCIPHYGMIHHKFWKAEKFLLKPPMTEEIDIVGSSAIQDARNELVKFAVDNGFKYVLFLDADMVPPQNGIFKLMSYDVPIVSGYFVSRSEPHYPCAFKFDKKQKGYISIYAPGTGLKPVDAVGMAFTLIDTKLFKEIPSPWFEFGRYGEDMMFCNKVREKGYRIFCDFDMIVPHIHLGKEKELTPDDYQNKPVQEESCSSRLKS